MPIYKFCAILQWLQNFSILFRKVLNITLYYSCNMETITFKLQEDILNKIDQLLKPLHFNNRTEFIREALREKINKIDKEEILEAFI